MTYTLCGIIKLVNVKNNEIIVNKINDLADKYGFGIILNLSDIFQEERELLQQLIDENSMPFYLTYSPKNPEGDLIFCYNLGWPSPKNKLRNPDRVINFFKEIWDMNEIIGIIFVVWDLATEVDILPKKRGNIDEYFEFLKNWYYLDSQDEGEMIFEVSKSGNN